jgi:signal transduction histidine kinase/DNA-binding NarL/FixJ family response regulator
VFSIKSLRTKTILSALIPTALVLVVAAIIGLYSYEQAAREVIQQRDAELARVSAARLSENLGQYKRILRSVAAWGDVQSMERARLSSALEDAQNQLYVFDAGVVVYNNVGVALWSQPFAAERQGSNFPVPSDFDKVRRTLRPVFSDVFKDEISGKDVILVGVPIVGREAKFKGVLAGMFKMKYPLLGPIYAEVLQLKVGHSGYAYLVDSNGRVIHHPDGSQVGRNLVDTEQVMQAVKGEVGAILTENSTGETIISGFASVPGTGWVLITEERWESVVGPIRSYSTLLLGVLVGGGLLSCILIFFSIGRILRPIQYLTDGAQRIAEGDFDYTIAAKTGDEIQALARQFNAMASALKEFYADLEQRVADRTIKLAALNAIAAVVSRSLDLESVLNNALDKTLEVTGIEAGGIYLLQEDDGVLTITAYKGLSAQFVAEIDGLKVGEGFSGHVVRTGEPLVVRDVSTDPRLTRMAARQRGFRSLASFPLVSRRKVLGTLFVGTRDYREFSRQDIELLTSIGHQIGVAVENARLFAQAEQRTREAEKARQAAEEANRAKSVFLANMSHELRTPLNAILGFAQLMTRDPSLTAEQKENLETISRSGEHLLTLINDVLEMSKIEAGGVTLQEESFDLHHLLDGLEEMFHLRAADKGLMLIYERTPSVPQYVRTDESKLRQVLINLLSNAVKFTQKGSVTLRVGYEEENSRLCFKVKDTGVGIAAQELETLFDPFVQTASGQASQEGTGLGMPISRQFARLMGGDLTFTSELGTGTLFKFDVPVELADATDIESEQPRRRVIGLEAGQPTCRLLIVEDREANRKLLLKLLEPLGFEIREALNGQEGIKIWEKWDPHLIWMDMRMPVMDGHEATKRIKATTKGQATVIIALTASAFEEDRKIILSEGCDDFVRKPFREAEIFDRLAKHLGVRFVYEGLVEEGKEEKAAKDVLTSAELASLPADWVADLYQAAVQADAELILGYLDQVRDQNGPLADALASLVHNFRFDIIMALTQ